MAESSFRSGMVALVGETNAGKSTLLNALLGTKVSIVASKPHTTRNRILGIKNLPNAQLVLVDTPGFVRSSSKNEMGKFTSRVLQEAASGVDLLLLVVDAQRLDRNRKAIDDLVANLRDRQLGVPAIVALNKIDLVRKDKLLPIMKELFDRFSASGGGEVELVPVSAAMNDGLDVLERIIIEKLPEGEQMFPDDTVSDQSEPFLASEIIREKLLRQLEEEVPHSAAVRIEDWEDSDDLLNIQAVILVEKESQKGIVIGRGGKQLKEIGQEARLELEALFGVSVFLKLFVKVESEWTKTEKGLAKAGYVI